MDALFNLNGFDSTLVVYEDHCVITGKKTLVGFICERAFDGSKEFYFSDITSVQYKEPGAIVCGFIQLEYPGSHSGEQNAGENTFTFTRRQAANGQYEKAYQYIKERVAFYKKQKNNPSAAIISPAEEIKKFKELLDCGIITKEEFAAKKKELLGL